MKKFQKTACIAAAFITVIVVSFLAGSLIKEQEHLDSRAQRCMTLISFAIDKAENHDLSNQDVMEALISNIYAAYEFCDDPNVSKLLHDLWNELIFDGDGYAGNKDALVTQLKDLAGMTRTES